MNIKEFRDSKNTGGQTGQTVDTANESKDTKTNDMEPNNQPVKNDASSAKAENKPVANDPRKSSSDAASTKRTQEQSTTGPSKQTAQESTALPKHMEEPSTMASSKQTTQESTEPSGPNKKQLSKSASSNQPVNSVDKSSSEGIKGPDVSKESSAGKVSGGGSATGASNLARPTSESMLLFMNSPSTSTNVAGTSNGATQPETGLNKHEKTTVDSNLDQIRDNLPKSDGVDKGVAVIQTLSNSSDPSKAQVGLQLSNTLAGVSPSVQANVLTLIPQLPPQRLVAVSGLVNAFAQGGKASGGGLNSNAMNNVANVLKNVPANKLDSSMKVFSDNVGILKKHAGNLDKMALLQAMITMFPKMSADEIMKHFAAIAKEAAGLEDEDERSERERQAALDRMVEFLGTYVSTGHAIWADKMNLKRQLKQQQMETKDQLSRQLSLLSKYATESDRDLIMA